MQGWEAAQACCGSNGRVCHKQIEGSFGELYRTACLTSQFTGTRTQANR